MVRKRNGSRFVNKKNIVDLSPEQEVYDNNSLEKSLFIIFILKIDCRFLLSYYNKDQVIWRLFVKFCVRKMFAIKKIFSSHIQ